jgi:hypothetical protein
MATPSNQLIGLSEIAEAIDAPRDLLAQLALEHPPIGVFRGVKVYDLPRARALADAWRGLSDPAIAELRADARECLKRDLKPFAPDTES